MAHQHCTVSAQKSDTQTSLLRHCPIYLRSAYSHVFCHDHIDPRDHDSVLRQEGIEHHPGPTRLHGNDDVTTGPIGIVQARISAIEILISNPNSSSSTLANLATATDSALIYRPHNRPGEGMNTHLLRSCGMTPTHPSYYGYQSIIGYRKRVNKAKKQKSLATPVAGQPAATLCLNDLIPQQHLLAICDDTTLNWLGTTPHRPKGKQARRQQAAAYALHPKPALGSAN